MNRYITFIICCVFSIAHAQQDSSSLPKRYWEDQLYISLSYNILVNQPSNVSDTSFSYGLSTGYIKDIPLTLQGDFAIGLGLGYSYDVFNQALIVSNSSVFTVAQESNSRASFHSIELPIQFRWRNSDVTTYTFWRVYTGMRLSYNLANTFELAQGILNDLNSYAKLQTGLELSVGYGALNFYAYYGLQPIFDNATITGSPINSRVVKFGFIFYIL